MLRHGSKEVQKGFKRGPKRVQKLVTRVSVEGHKRSAGVGQGSPGCQAKVTRGSVEGHQEANGTISYDQKN